MDTIVIPSLLRLYQEAAPADFFRQLSADYKLPTGGIYQPSLVIWLMIRQRLDPKGTLSSAVQQVVRGESAPLLPPHKRVREKTVSNYTGAYSRARTELPVDAAEQVADRIFTQLMAHRQSTVAGLSGPVFLLDGSSLATPSTKDLREQFPPASNQHGPSHWPTIRIVVAHDLATGFAVRPQWGPMYGAKACSEQALAEQVMDRLPSHSTVLADRNFGVFSVAWAAQQKKRTIIARLTESRARKIAGVGSVATLAAGTDRAVEWKPSQAERRAHPELPDDAVVRGRLIVTKVARDGEMLHLYLFTTLEIPPDEVVELYGQRWNIETDLRSLKQTVRLQHLTSKTNAMITKELLTAVAAYNLVRGVQYAAAALAGIEARQLSFSHVQDVVNAWLPLLMSITDTHIYDYEFQRMLRTAARCRLPKRRNRRSYPRAVWGHKQCFPKRKEGWVDKKK